MGWRRLTVTPEFGVSPPPWRPFRLDTHNPPFGLPEYRKRTLCRVRIETLLNGVTVDDVISGWDYFAPFEATYGALATNDGTNSTKLIYTIEAAPDIGAPWRYIWRDRIMPADTYDAHDIIIAPGDTRTIEYEAASGESLSFYEAMLCVIC